MPFLLPAAASAVAAAAPAAAAAGASAAATAGIGATLTSIAGNVLMNVAISAAMSIFQPQVGVAGRTFEWTLDPDGPIPFAAGRIGVPGSAVYRKTFGPDLMYYGIPSVISGAGPIAAFEGFMADDETVTFDGSGKAVSSQYAGELWYKNKLGTQPDSAITSPTGLKNDATLPGWTSAHKLSGKASYMIVMGENSKGTAFPTGEIKPLITLRGLLVYDPRKDSTYPGGSGEHRLSNPLTWEYSANPILWALKWTLGLWEGPNGKGAPQVDYQVGGIGAKLSGIDVPAFVAAANVADANGWTCAAYPTTDDDKHQVLTGFLQAGGAIYAQRAGKISCIQRAAPRTSIVTVSAYDTAGPLEIDTAASRIDRINTLRPRFWSEPHRWQMTALDQEVTAQAYRDEDGGVRPAGIDYPYVTDGVQAAQLAALQIANTREGIAGVIPLKPHLQRIRPGDAFTITEAGFVLNGLKCLCLNTDYDPATGVVRVSFVSETDAKYPFALGQDPTPPTPQVLTPVDPRYVTPPAPGDWTVTPRPPSQGGTQQPGFDLTGFVSNSTATAIIVETGPSAAGPWKQAYQGPPTVTNIPIDGLQPGATYFIAIQYQRNQNYSEREVFGPFTAPDLIADVMPDAPGLSPIKEAIAAANEGLEQIGDAVDGLNQTVYDAQTGLQVRTGQLWDDINDAADGLKVRTAGLDEAINAAGTGLADRTDALFDRLDAPGTGIEARVTDLAQTVEDGDEASIDRFQALEAFAAAGPNHCPNGGLAEGLAGLSSGWPLVWAVSDTWGPNVAIVPSGDGTYVIEWPEFDAAESVAYTVSGDTVLFAAGGASYFDLQFRNASGQVVHDGAQSARGPGDFSDSFARRKAMAATTTCPVGSGAVTAQARCVFQNVVNPTAMAARRVKIDFGDKPTAWSDETTEWQGASRLIDLDEVVQNPTSGLVRRTELLDAQLNTPTVGLSAQIASARQAITDLDGQKAESSDLQALNTQINTPGTGLAAQQLSSQQAISDLEEGKASASDLDFLTGEITTARGNQTSLNARLNTVESDIDGKASSTALQTLESEVNAPGTGIVARLTDAEGTLVELETGKAEASDLEALEVRSRTLPNLIPNSAAAQDLYLWDGGPIWKVGYGADVGSYFFCDAAGDQYLVSKPIRLGPNKTYSFEFEGDGGTAPSENAVYFDLMDGTDTTPGGVVQFGAGARSYQGVGWFTREGNSFTTGPTVKWGVAVVKKAAAANYVTMTRLMLNDGPVVAAWADTLVARDLSARQVEMERVVLTPTTGLAERVFGLDSDLYTPTTGFAARLGDAERTLVDLDEGKASASDVEALASSINTPGTGLLAEMAAVKETLVDLDEGKASASDVEDIQSALFTPTTGISARLTEVLQTAADLEQEKADVTALQQLEAITGVRENLALNGGLTDGLEGLGGGSGMVLDDDSWGRSVKLATFTGTGTRVIDWPAVDSDPDTVYTISGDAVLFASGGVVYFDLLFLNAAGEVVGDGGQKPRGPGDFSNAPGRRQDMAVAHLSPSTTVRMVPRCVFQDVVNPTAMGARLVKVERGGLPATTWSDEASAAYTASKLADLNRVVTSPTTGLASRLAVTESEINTPGTGLKARQQALTEALTDLDEGKASVVSVEDITAQLRTVPNQIANPAAKFGLDRWNGAPAWGVGHSGDVGDYFVCSATGEYYLVSQPFRLSPNTTYTQSFEGDGGSDPGACSAYLDLLGGTEATPGTIVTYGAGAGSFNGVGWFTRKSVTFTTGPDVMWGQYVVRKAATTSYVATTRFMLNVGDKAAAWTDSLSERELRASIQEVRSVAVSADGRSKAIVANLTDVNGRIIGTVSENDGESDSYTVVSSKFALEDPDGTAGTSFADGRWTNPDAAAGTRTVYGRAFGGDQKLEWWTGPASVAVGAETKGNAYVYISRNAVGGPRFGGSDVVGPGGTLTATASTGFIGGVRTGAGYVATSNQVTVTVSGGTAGATIRWVRISGDSRIQMNDPTAFNTGAGATIGVGEVISAYFMGAITKGGQSAVVYVQVDLSDNGT